MKNLKKFTAVCAAALVVASVSLNMSSAFAYESPAEAAAGVTGKTIEEIAEERTDGKTYGQIAAELGKLDEYHEAMLQMKTELLNEYVEDDKLTQAEADIIITALKERHTLCDGTGSGCGNGINHIGINYGGGHGHGHGKMSNCHRSYK